METEKARRRFSLVNGASLNENSDDHDDDDDDVVKGDLLF